MGNRKYDPERMLNTVGAYKKHAVKQAQEHYDSRKSSRKFDAYRRAMKHLGRAESALWNVARAIKKEEEENGNEQDRSKD